MSSPTGGRRCDDYEQLLKNSSVFSSRSWSNQQSLMRASQMFAPEADKKNSVTLCLSTGEKEMELKVCGFSRKELHQLVEEFGLKELPVRSNLS